MPGYLADKHPELIAKVKEEYPEVLAHYRARRYVTGYKVLEAWPEDLWAGLGKDFSLLTGFLDYKAEIYADAIDELKALAEDADLRRPAPRAVVLPGALVLRGVAVHEGRRRAGALRPLADRAGPGHPPGRDVIFSRR